MQFSEGVILRDLHNSSYNTLPHPIIPYHRKKPNIRLTSKLADRLKNLPVFVIGNALSISEKTLQRSDQC